MTGNGAAGTAHTDVGCVAPLVLTKHEGAGNDFLVALAAAEGGPGGGTVPGGARLGSDAARFLCDRHRGVGADGLILLGPASDRADCAMRLWNADGSEAEMSGNGIRCLAQAAVDAGLAAPPRFTVATAAGVRTVDYRPGDRPWEATAWVEMGPVRVGAERAVEPPGVRAVEADVGNPHLVVLVDLDVDAVDLEALAADLAAGHPLGVNVEVVRPGPGPDDLALRVWERGVGETLACGTGTCAAAAVARRWGLVGDRVRVANPGGDLEVALGPGDPPDAVLGGPVRRVAQVRVDPQLLAGAEAGVAAGATPTAGAAGRR